MDIQSTLGGAQPTGQPMGQPSQQPGRAGESANYDSSKTTFSVVIKETFALFKKNFVIYTGLFLAAETVAFGIEYLGRTALPKEFEKGSNAVYLAIAGVIIIGIVAAIVRLIGYCSILRAASLADAGKISFADALSHAAGRFMAEVGLCIRVFFYTGIWLIGLLMISWTGGAILMMSLGVELPMLGLVVGIAPIVALVLFFVYLRRMLRAAFAFPIMLSGENMSGKEALAGSIKLADGMTGRIFSNYFLLYIVLFLIMMVLAFPAANIAGSVVGKPSTFGSLTANEYRYSLETTTTLIMLLPVALMYSFMTLFNYAFMKKAAESKL